MKESKKFMTGLAALGAVVGTSLLVSKMRENNKSSFEKFIDQVESWMK
ncbi:MAG: hypothetical protein JWO96_528 [Candidatus Saccharibacteria bacterium]|nr:hypothetical protein [Candidatus Saccharibacteria bacterium]